MNINLYGIHAAKASTGVTPAPSVQMDAALRKYESIRPSGAEQVNTDTVMISSEGSQKRDAARITRGMIDEIERSEQVYARRVEDIRARVQNNTYHVSSGDVADAILRRACGAGW